MRSAAQRSIGSGVTPRLPATAILSSSPPTTTTTTNNNNNISSSITTTTTTTTTATTTTTNANKDNTDSNRQHMITKYYYLARSRQQPLARAPSDASASRARYGGGNSEAYKRGRIKKQNI